MKALVSLRICAYSPEASLLADAKSAESHAMSDIKDTCKDSDFIADYMPELALERKFCAYNLVSKAFRLDRLPYTAKSCKMRKICIFRHVKPIIYN